VRAAAPAEKIDEVRGAERPGGPSRAPTDTGQHENGRGHVAERRTEPVESRCSGCIPIDGSGQKGENILASPPRKEAADDGQLEVFDGDLLECRQQGELLPETHTDPGELRVIQTESASRLRRGLCDEGADVEARTHPDPSVEEDGRKERARVESAQAR